MADVRQRLPRTFGAFFGRFDRWTEVQELALPAVLEGTDVLICAPTASGKTEAYAAPAAEMILGGERNRSRVVIVSPTRALANDLKRRLEGRLTALGVGFGRYTGEHKEKRGGGLPEICVTTPEALDSLLTRRPRSLSAVRMIVLDEIHVLDATPRGDQLRVLLHRLEQAARHRPQRIGVSATIDAPEEAAQRYLENARVITAGGARRIRAKAFYGRTASEMADHLGQLAASGFRKVLVFCQRRADVEDFVSKLKGRCRFGDDVHPHHGSLSQSIRERTERRFLEAPAAVAFATMTLELGIDIGTVDYILLARPPSDVSSLLQRIGRGGRRTDSSRAGYVVCDAGDAMLFRVLLRSGARGQLLSGPYGVRPGVIVQQALCVAASEGWIEAQQLESMVPPAIWSEIAPTSAREVLDALVVDELLEEPRSGRYVVTEDVERRYALGTLHSNIGDKGGQEIVDRLTGEVLGRLPMQDEHRMNFGGGARKIVRKASGRVLTDQIAKAETSTFTSNAAACCTLAQGRAVVHELGLDDDAILQTPLETSTLLVHGLGTIGGLLLAQLLVSARGKSFVIKSSPYELTLAQPIDELPRPGEDAIHEFVRNHERRLARLLGMGPWHKALPEDLRVRAILRASGLEEARAFLGKARFEKDAELEPEMLEAARCL